MAKLKADSSAASYVAGLKAVVATLPTTTRVGLRNRALLLVGWFGALRRSELVALNRDVRDDVDGLVVKVRSSKTDHEGVGAVLGLPRRADELCPAVAVRHGSDGCRRGNRWLTGTGVKHRVGWP